MSDVWELIVDSSTLPDVSENDLWDHLNNLGAGGPGTGVVLLDGLEIEMDNRCLEVQVDLEADKITDDALEFEVFIEDFDYDIEIC